MRFKTIATAAAALTLGVASAAQATAFTQDISGSANSSGGPSLYVVNFDFTLPVGFSNAELDVTDLQVDDRGVLQLNGVDIDSAGIFGPGNGMFDFGGGNVPHAFGINGARDVVVGSGFLTGLNTLRLIVNDTSAGIGGGLVNGPGGPSGTTGYVLEAQLNYDARDAAGGVPEPATWALMIAGFGLAGAALRRRRATVA